MLQQRFIIVHHDFHAFAVIAALEQIKTFAETAFISRFMKRPKMRFQDLVIEEPEVRFLRPVLHRTQLIEPQERPYHFFQVTSALLAESSFERLHDRNALCGLPFVPVKNAEDRFLLLFFWQSQNGINLRCN